MRTFFNYGFSSVVLFIDMFRTTKSAQTSVSNTSSQGLDCLYGCMIKYRKAACTDFLMMNNWLFETCRK